MTPRETIRENVRRGKPERIGLNFDGGRHNDFRNVSIGPSPCWKQKRWTEGNVEYYDDEWGNVWHRISHMGSLGEIFRPVLEDWKKLDSYELPRMDDPARFAHIPEKIKSSPDRFHAGSLPGFPFGICRYMRKMEVYLQDLVVEREKVDELHRRVTDLLQQIICRYGEAGCDGIIFAEDWGTQERTLVSPAMWHDIYAPLYRRLCGTAHDYGMDVLMHSCGYNWAILDDLADAGVNALQFDQPALYGLERLAEKFRDRRLCLYSPVDIQKVLPTGDREKIEAEARRMVALFRGGFIAKNYPDLHGIGVKPEWDGWAYEAFLSAGCPPGTI